MNGLNERSSLLANSIRTTAEAQTDSIQNGAQHEAEANYENEEDEELDEETLDMLMAKFSTSVGSLGLGGAIQGVPFMRRGSISISHLPRRPSQVGTDHLYGAPRRSISGEPAQSDNSRRKSVEYSTFPDQRRESISKRPIVEESSQTSRKETPYLGGVSPARFWAMFGSILLVYFVACFDSTLMASSHPVITSYFKASNAASWLSTSFLLTSTAFQPMFGRMSDTIGRRIPFLFSLAIFTLGTTWCACAQTIMNFIFARAACGLGAGGAMAMGAIINSDMVPLEVRGSYQSILNLAFGIGSSLGAALGGFLADALGWRWEFGIQVPAIFICWIVAWVVTPDNLGPQLAKNSKTTLLMTIKEFDLAGSFFLTTSVTFLILALNLGGNVLPWDHPTIIISLIFFVVCGGLLIRAEKRADKPIMPLEFLFSSPRGNLVISNFLASMTMNTILFNLPLFFQAVLLDTPTRSGTRLALPFIFNMAAGFSTGLIITWSHKLKPTLVLGYFLMVVGSIALTTMTKSLPSWVYTQFVVASSMGQGFSYPSVSLSMLATSTVEELAVATSTLILWRSLGTVMGVAVSSLVVQNALIYYLEKFVVGSDKEEIIRQVRSSIEAVARLPSHYQTNVIDAYLASVRLSFVLAAITSAMALMLIVKLKLPKLGNKHQPDSMMD